MSNQAAIEVQQLYKTYGSLIAVNGVSFQVNKGEIFGLLGPNGAGKSTTIEAIIGLRQDVQGQIHLLGMDLRKEGEKIKKKIGVQLQSSSFIKKLKVKELLKLIGSFYEHPLDVDVVLEQVNLNEEKHRYMHQLSGGQQQRVGTAMSFISNGDIIFLDEPTIGLDALSRRHLWEAILSMKKQGKTIFLTTHYMDEAQILCDRIAIMDEGKIVAEDTPENLISNYCKETVLEFAPQEVQGEVKEYLEQMKTQSRVEFGQDKCRLYTTNLPLVLQELYKEESPIKDLNNVAIRQPDLEDVFITLTGKELHNESAS